MKTSFSKKIVYLASYFLLFSLFGRSSLAQSGKTFDNGLKATGEKAGYTGALLNLGPDFLAQKIISLVLSWVGVLFLILTIYGGLMWMTAQGNDQKMEKAKTVLIAAISGLVVVMTAYAISLFVMGNFIK